MKRFPFECDMLEKPETPDDETIAGAPPSKNSRRVRPAPLMWGMALGLVLVIAAVLAFAILTGERLPRLTPADYDAALARWQAQGPADYNLDLEIVGNRPGKIHVEVRGREAVRMTRDGIEPKQKRTWDYWTVPGQFDTIGEELEMARDPAASFNSPAVTQMVMWAEFDPQYGYPRRYDRVVLGADFETHWKVTRFEPLPPSSAEKK